MFDDDEIDRSFNSLIVDAEARPLSVRRFAGEHLLII
jgi:hypothetical protein